MRNLLPKKKHAFRCLLYLCLITAGYGVHAQTQVPRTIPAPYTINNIAGYYEALPVDYTTSGKNHPLIIFIHGVGELAGKNATAPTASVTNNGPPRLIRDGQFPQHVTSNGVQYSFIVISPQFKEWPGSADVFKLLDYLKTKYRIDLNRVYITGLSMGGGVTWGALSENVETAKQVAASIVVCGAWDPSGVSQLPANIALNNIPVWATHNDKDPTVPLAFSQGWVNGINKAVPADKYPARLTVFSSTSHNAWSKTYDPNYKDPATGLNAYEWLLQYSKDGATTTPPPTEPPPPVVDPNAGKRISVKTSSTNIIYYDNAMTQLGVKPGDTLCIPPGDYEYIHFGKLTGTADKPIVITNCGGLVRTGVNSSATAASFVFSTCTYIKVEGNGAPGIQYGFDVNGTNKDGMKMFGAYFGNGTSDFEIHHVYIHDAGMFLQAKTLQTCEHPEWLDGRFVMKNVKIHDLLCRNSAWEGFYIGNTHYLWNGTGCTDMKSHRLENISIYNNDLENMGSDGMQVSLADKGDNRVYNNRVVNYAMARNSPHGYGILCGGGSTLRIYNNYVSKGYNSGIEIFGSGINYVYNNVVSDIRFEGINVADKLQFEPATAYIYNNTVYNTGNNGLKIYADLTTIGHKVYNNIVVAPGTAWDRPLNGYYIQGSKAVLYDFANNLNYKTLDEAGFQDYGNGNVRLKAGAGAIDKGRNMSDLGLSTDFDNKARPYNGAYDIGAFEYTGATPSQFLKANAGADQLIVPPATSFSLNGSSSASQGGTITGYAWKKVSGPIKGTLSNASTATPQVTGIIAGTYVFELKVTDNTGATATDMVTISVLNAANKAPVSEAGSDITLTLPSNSTPLTGSYSIDPDGVIVSYEWKKISGPAAGAVEDITASNTNLTGLTAGTYVYELVCVDNGGLKGTDRVTITVQGESTNKAPVAKAGADVTVSLPVGTLVLDGSGSTDADGSISSYSWKKISGPTGGDLTAATSMKTNVTSLATAGEYLYELTVKDNEGAAATDQVKVTVTLGANKLPVADAGADVTIMQPVNAATLDGSASKDEDGSIASLEWRRVSAPAGATGDAISSPFSARTNVTGLNTLGKYVYELAVTDNRGGKSTSQVTVEVIATTANKAPVIKVNDVTITLPVNSVTLDASASYDEDGSVATWGWKRVSGPAGGTIVSYTTPVTDVTGFTTAGTYIYELTIFDNEGSMAVKRVTVTVNASAVNKPPVAAITGEPTVKLPLDFLFLDAGTSTDEDGTITGYAWTQLSGPSQAEITRPDKTQTRVGLLQAGEYVFQVTVTDDDNATANATYKVTVLEDESAENPELSVYPNPASSFTRIQFANPGSGKMTIRLYDMQGRIKKEMEENVNQVHVYQKDISLEGIPDGSYIVEVTINNLRKTSRIIKLGY